MIISCARHSTQGNGNTVAITVLLQLHHTRKVVKVDALLKPGSDKYTLQYPVPVRGDMLFNKQNTHMLLNKQNTHMLLNKQNTPCLSLSLPWPGLAGIAGLAVRPNSIPE